MSSRYGRFLASKHDRWEARTKPRLTRFLGPGEITRFVILGVSPSFPWILIPVCTLTYPLLHVHPVSVGLVCFAALVFAGMLIAQVGQRLIVVTDGRMILLKTTLLGRPRASDVETPLQVAQMEAREPGAFGTQLMIATPTGPRRFLVLKGAQPGLARLVAAVRQHVPPRPV